VFTLRILALRMLLDLFYMTFLRLITGLIFMSFLPAGENQYHLGRHNAFDVIGFN